MKWISGKKRMAGISLIDALIAIVVLGVGLAALSKFHGEMIATSGLSKTRTQAVTLAQEKMEELRTNLDTTDYNGRVTGSDTPAIGGFTRSWSVTDGTDPNNKSISVTVSWTDPREGTLSTTLNSVVVWDNPLGSALATDPATFNGTGAIPVPTGGGEMGDYSDYVLQDGDIVASRDNGDGTKFVKTAEGEVLLLTTDSNLLLTVSPTIIKITGTASLDSEYPPGGFTADNITDLEPVAADAGVCTETASGDYLNFNCYVGSLWFGRISMMAEADGALVHVSDHSNSNDQVCPLTYRYGSTAALFADPNFTATAADADMEPFLAGVLANQNFVVMGSRGECRAAYTISGTVTLNTGSINMNEINVTASGATQGCTITASDTNTGVYSCQVSSGWTGSITFTGYSCTGFPSTEYANVSTDITDENKSITGCTLTFDELVTLTGTVATRNGARNLSVQSSGIASGYSYAPECSMTGVITQNEVGGYDYGYECQSVPTGWAGAIGASADNCGSATGSVSEIPAGSVSPYQGPTIYMSECAPAEYIIYGKMEVPSGGFINWNKVVIDVYGEYGLIGASCEVKGSGSIAEYYCSSVTGYPGSRVYIDAWSTDTNNYYYFEANSYEGVTLGHYTSQMRGVDFTIFDYGVIY